jgi:hypothetical protein
MGFASDKLQNVCKRVGNFIFGGRGSSKSCIRVINCATDGYFAKNLLNAEVFGGFGVNGTTPKE